MDKNDKDLDYSYFKDFIKPIEGQSDDVYADQKGNPTVGHGFNLNSDLTKGVMATRGIDPQEVIQGNRSLSSDESDEVLRGIYDAKKEHLNNLKENYFPGANLNPAQKASVMSLMYNNPTLVGPDLRNHLNNNDSVNVIREMLLNSNKDEDPGILKRRLREAELYGGPVDFNLAIKHLQPEEREKIQKIINKMKNENELAAVKDKYQFLKPTNEQASEPVTFYKSRKLLGD